MGVGVGVVYKNIFLSAKIWGVGYVMQGYATNYQLLLSYVTFHV